MTSVDAPAERVLPSAEAVCVAAVIVLALVLPSSAGAAWKQPVGGTSPIGSSTTQDSFQPRLATIGGVPHVAWSESDGVNNELRVARLGAAAWQQPWAGVSATSGGINQSTFAKAAFPSLASVGGVPYVAWGEDDGTNFELRVGRLSGSTWQQPWAGVSATSGGINQSTGLSAARANLASVAGVPYVAWSEVDGTNLELRVARLNASHAGGRSARASATGSRNRRG